MSVRKKWSCHKGFCVLLISIFALTVLADDRIPCLSCVKVNDTCYNMTYQFDLEANFREQIVIHQMGIMRSSNVLYYTFEPEIHDAEYVKVGFINLNDYRRHGVLKAKDAKLNFGVFDIDQDNNVIYFGGSDGVYTLQDTDVSHYSSRGDRIVSMFFKEYIYFVRDGEVIRKKGNEFIAPMENDEKAARNETLPKTTIKKFLITKDNVVVFLSSQGLFATNFARNSKVVFLSNNSYFRGLVMDLDGVVYAWWLDGIYKVVLNKNLADSTVVKVADINGIGAMTFDNDNNMLFTSDASLFKLEETKGTKC